MRQYLSNLTSSLIRNNRFDEDYHAMNQKESFIDHAMAVLVTGDVAKMTPQKLGRLMCSFTVGEVFVPKDELIQKIHFSGDSREMLREMVSLFLAWMIWDRLDTISSTSSL